MDPYFPRVLISVFFLSMLSIGCVEDDDEANGESDACAEGTSRCQSQKVERCHSGIWEDWNDCAVQSMICAMIKGEATCLNSGDADVDAVADTASDADADSDTDTDSDADADSDTDTDSDADADSDTDTDSDADTDTDTGSESRCPYESTEHTTSISKRTVCCPLGMQFCDEHTTGYYGGCWSEMTDCETIIECDGKWQACIADTLPFCDNSGQMWCQPCPQGSTRYETLSGKPFCCAENRPQFCDEEGEFRGGCWTQDVDCTSITYCEDNWKACFNGTKPVCEDDKFICQVEP